MKAAIFLITFSMFIFATPVKAEEASRLEKPVEERGYVSEITEKDLARMETAEPSAKITRTPWDKVFLIFDLNALGLYSRIGGGDGISGVNVDLRLAPAIILGPRDFLIPLYKGSYSRTKRAVIETEGTQLYEQFQSHNANLAWRHRFSDALTGKINIFGTWDYSVETKNESWGKGLYDYEDIGLDLDLRHTNRLGNFQAKKYDIGFEFYERKYPNYKSLITLASVTAPEEDEKDYRGYRVTGGYKFTRFDNWSLGLNYSFLFKDFNDKKIIDADGVLTGDERDDFVQDIGLEYSCNIGDNWILGLNNSYRIYQSNQNFYDSRGTIPLTDDVYTGDYYDFYSVSLRPGITYWREIAPQRRLVVSLAYGFTYKQYGKRKTQDFSGSYEDDDQVDKISNVTLNVKYPLNKKWALRFLADYMSVDSKMDYEQYYVYDYELYNVGAGFSYSF